MGAVTQLGCAVSVVSVLAAMTGEPHHLAGQYADGHGLTQLSCQRSRVLAGPDGGGLAAIIELALRSTQRVFDRSCPVCCLSDSDLGKVSSPVRSPNLT